MLTPKSWDILSKNYKGSDPLNPNPQQQVHLTIQSPRILSNELFIQVTPISKVYTDDTGRFPIHAHSGNQYIMIAYHCDVNMRMQERGDFRTLVFLLCYGSILYVHFHITSSQNGIVRFRVYIKECDHAKNIKIWSHFKKNMVEHCRMWQWICYGEAAGIINNGIYSVHCVHISCQNHNAFRLPPIF